MQFAWRFVVSPKCTELFHNEFNKCNILWCTLPLQNPSLVFKLQVLQERILSESTVKLFLYRSPHQPLPKQVHTFEKDREGRATQLISWLLNPRQGKGDRQFEVYFMISRHVQGRKKNFALAPFYDSTLNNAIKRRQILKELRKILYSIRLERILVQTM